MSWQANRGSDFGLTVEPLGRLGGEIHGLDVSNFELCPNFSALLRTELARFQVLVLRRQVLEPCRQAELTKCLGPLEGSLSRRPREHRVTSHPDVLYLSNEPGSSTAEYGLGWHSDGLAYAKTPHGATVLYCVACPEGVGDTLFASQYDALSATSDQFRSLLRQLYWYLPRIPHSEVPKGRGLIQPMVRTHVGTKREFLFCAPGASQIYGMSVLESAGILGIVRMFQARDDFIYRHRWQPGDVVIWENCALLHTRADLVDYARDGLRAMHRSATAGDFSAREVDPAD